jgi:iron complex outermembrane receptor protein
LAVRVDSLLVSISLRPLAAIISRKIAVGLLLTSFVVAAKGQTTAHDLTKTSLEDLMNMEVTTVSKRQQKLTQAPAAVYVITHEDIRRSGMTSIPDLLRMVPGVQVGQIQGGAWAVSARGFNGQYSNKLLVLVDGRSVYSPMDSDVFWDQQDTLLEDIERIEVIRGPGATLWGANAVNGVINIITKPARETQGVLATTWVGDQGQSLAGFRYGGKLGARGQYRAFAKYMHGRGLENRQRKPNIDGESSVRAGFRADWALSGEDSFTAEGEVFRARSASEFSTNSIQPPFAGVSEAVQQAQGVNLMATWVHRQSARSKTALRMYYDHSERSGPVFSEAYSTIDADFQHQLTLSETNELVWGLGFRDSGSRSSTGFTLSYSPQHRNEPIFSGFIQDQWSIANSRVSLILGSKFEHNNFTGVEIQPGARLLWTPGKFNTLWTSVSRAVRTPSYADRDLRINVAAFAGRGGTTTVIGIFGDPGFGSENLLSYELGYRLQAKRRVSVDLASFYNIYGNLKTYAPGTPFFEAEPKPAHLVIPSHNGNQMHGETYGLEIASNWKITERWRLIPSYNWLRVDLRLDPASHDQASLSAERESPRHQFQFRSELDLSRKLQFDSAIYYTSALPALAVDAYTRLDGRLGYRPRPDLEISLAGQNLQGGRHTEFVSSGAYTRATIGRSFFVKLTWGF